MKLKGVMTIELTDGNTGDVETVTEENMVTDSVNNILGFNPAGMYMNVSGQYDTMQNWNDVLLPICPNMIGGILLFPSALTEDAGNLYPGSDNLPVAYASNDVNSSADTQRGSLNLTESAALDNGYRFVWEFTPSQGNGAIAAVALTSAKGGVCGFGSTADDASPFLQMKEVDLGDRTDDELEDLFKMAALDFAAGCFYSLGYESSAVTIRKLRMPIFDIGLNERLDDSTCTLLSETALTCSTFKFPGSYTPYGAFYDGQDGYFYGFGNQANSSGDATLYWIRIAKEDYSFTEGVWAVSNAHMLDVGSYKFSSYPCRITKSVVRNGYLYAMAYDKTGLYKINVENQADVSKIEFGFTSAWKPLGGSGSAENYMILVGDLIIGWDFQVTVTDAVIQTVGTERFENIATPVFQYKNFLTCISGSYGTENHHWFLLMPYLATINNLSSAVMKTVDKTMKITYTLTEETTSG